MSARGDRDTRIVYEIYPRSWRDTTGSGEGDLAGVTAGLDHVAALGADTLWLAPFYPSPWADGGYDIADHCGVDPRFGDLDDFARLREATAGRGLDLIVDLVLNHTSDRHDWFLRASAREEGYDDYYVFADPKPDGTPPNNWRSFFGEQAWRWVAQRRQYVLTQFLHCQPCLDLRNPAVQAAQQKTLDCWRSRGVDGFRLDAVCSYLYDRSLADNPPADPAVREASANPGHNPYAWQDHVYDMLPGDGQTVASMLRRWAGPDAFLLGEINSGNRSIGLARDFARPGRLDAGYTVDLLGGPPSAGGVARLLDALDGGPIAWALSTHDHARHASRMGDGSARDARLFAVLLIALPGHLMLYQGEELGLPQPDLPFDAITDPFDKLYYPLGPGREGARVPIPWRAEAPHVGFTNGTPWIAMPEGWSGHAVDAQERDAGSVLAFYRRALALRRREAALHSGEAEVGDATGDMLVIERHAGRERLCCAINFSSERRAAPCSGEPLIASAPLVGGDRLGPRSAAIWRVG
ncbi:MAG: alpha-amylase family glycosyl hydrolase [Paracoccaceae bacterium]